MNKIKLYYRDKLNNLKFIDIENDIKLNKLNYEISDSIFTLDFELPYDLKNPADINFINYCNLQYEDYQIFGKVELLSIENYENYLNKKRIFKYQFIEQKINIFEELHKFKISDLSDIELRYTSQEICNSLDRQPIDKYVWVFQDPGYNCKWTTYIKNGNNVIYNSFDEFEFDLENKGKFFRPVLFVKYLIDKMFERLGYIVEYRLDYIDINKLLLPTNSEFLKLYTTASENDYYKIFDGTHPNFIFQDKDGTLINLNQKRLDLFKMQNEDTLTIQNDGSYNLIISMEANQNRPEFFTDLLQYPIFEIIINDQVVKTYIIFKNQTEYDNNYMRDFIDINGFVLNFKSLNFLVKNIFINETFELLKGDTIRYKIYSGYRWKLYNAFAQIREGFNISCFNINFYVNQKNINQNAVPAVINNNLANKINLKQEIIDATAKDFLLSTLNTIRSMISVNNYEKKITIYDNINYNFNYVNITDKVDLNSEIKTYKNKDYKILDYKENKLIEIFGEQKGTQNEFRYPKKYATEKLSNISTIFTDFQLYNPEKQLVRIGDEFYPFYFNYDDANGSGTNSENNAYLNTYRKGSGGYTVPLLYLQRNFLSGLTGPGITFGTYNLEWFNTLVPFCEISGLNYYLYYRDVYDNSTDSSYNSFLDKYLPLSNSYNICELRSLYNIVNNYYNIYNKNVYISNIELSAKLTNTEFSSTFCYYINNFYFIDKIEEFSLKNSQNCKINLIYNQSVEVDYTQLPIKLDYSDDYEATVVVAGIDDTLEDSSIVINGGEDDILEDESSVINSK